MKKILISVMGVVSLVTTVLVQAGESSIKFSNLQQGQTVSNPVEVCMEASGVVIEPVSNGVRPGHGHMHILVDYPLPSDLNKPLTMAMPNNVKHLGDGTTCRTLELSAGWHTLRALVASGKHEPGEPPVTGVIDIKVK